MSKSYHSYEEWDPEYIEYRFSCFGTCSNIKCGEGFVISGTGTENHIMIQDHFTGDYEESYESRYSTNYIHPAVSLFPLLDDYPDSVISELQRAFRIFWLDYNSCANALRQSLERSLDEIGIKKTEFRKKKNSNTKARAILSLHKRASFIPHKYSNVKNTLLAAKWIANAGSHKSDLTCSDIFDALDLTEYTVNSLFDPAPARIASLAKSVNKKKRPIGTP